MKTVSLKYENVNPDGTLADRPGAVVTQGTFIMSAKNGGCGFGNCNCSPGHWICKTEPRTADGVVNVTTFKFDDKDEMDDYLKENDIERI
jgi:hypothetical protein